MNYDFKSVYNPQFLLDVDAAKDYVDNLIEDISKGMTAEPAIKDSIRIDAPIADIYVDGNGNVVVVTETIGKSEDGNQEEKESGEGGNENNVGGGLVGNNENGDTSVSGTPDTSPARADIYPCVGRQSKA